MTTVLIAEDEARIVRFLERGLQAAGYTTHSVSDGATALDLALSGAFDLLLLDLGLPSRDGFAVLTELRARRSRLPVVVLTARNEPEDIVAGLDGGADDYVTKPFRLAELLARARALLRRTPPEEVEAAPLVRLDAEARRAFVGENELQLTAKEFELLRVLVREQGKVVSREQLMHEIWETAWLGSTKTLDMHVSVLRRKLGDDATSPRFITTVRGVGFRFEPTGGGA